MDELFGAPVISIAAFLAVVFGLALAYLLFIRIRNPILVRMAIRNATRRPGQSLLIIMGLMLGTAIIASAFTIGDSVSYSIKSVATESLRHVDELVAVDQESEVWTGRALPKGFTEESVAGLLSDLQADPDVDGVLPVLSENVASRTRPHASSSRGRRWPASTRSLRPDSIRCTTPPAPSSTWPDWGRTRSTSPRRPPSPCRPRWGLLTGCAGPRPICPRYRCGSH